jgi:hypothetical protein
MLGLVCVLVVCSMEYVRSRVCVAVSFYECVIAHMSYLVDQ